MYAGKVYEVTIKMDLRQDAPYCCCSMIKLARRKNTPLECLNPGAKDWHFVRLVNGNVVAAASKHKACPFCTLASKLPIHITRCYILPDHALLTLICRGEVLNQLYDKLDEMKMNYKIVSIGEISEKTRRQKTLKLTQNQRIALLTALHLGYFDTPQKAHIREISKTLGKSPATVHELLKRGIRNILSHSGII